jgi:hypothetical protein
LAIFWGCLIKGKRVLVFSFEQISVISFKKKIRWIAFENPRHQRSKDNNENNIKQSKRQFPFELKTKEGI